MRTRTIARLGAAALLLGSATPAVADAPKRNLLEEGASFEVGVDVFSLNIQYLLSHHGKEIQPVFDDTTAMHGKHSLRLDNPLGDKIYLAFRPIRLAKDAEVTVSGYLKGEGKTPVQLMRWPWATTASADVESITSTSATSCRQSANKFRTPRTRICFGLADVRASVSAPPRSR